MEDAALNVAAAPTCARASALEIALLKGFDLRRGDERVSLPLSAQRVLAFVGSHAVAAQQSQWRLPTVESRNHTEARLGLAEHV